MPETRDGWLIFEPVFDSIVVRFDRTLPYPSKQVWERLVDRTHLHEWLSSEPGGHIRHRKDGDVYLPTIGGAVIESYVYEFIPEQSLSFGWVTFDWDGGAVGWGLEPVNGGTLVHFEHSDDDLGPDHFARLLANWHMTLDMRHVRTLAGRKNPVVELGCLAGPLPPLWPQAGGPDGKLWVAARCLDSRSQGCAPVVPGVLH